MSIRAKQSRHIDALTITANPNGLLDKILTEVSICLPSLNAATEANSNNHTHLRGLWDTGASGTVITPTVAASLGIKPIDQKEVFTGSGAHLADVYLVDVLLPMGVLVPNLLVIALPLTDLDVLIGMDIVTLGDFSLTNFNGQTYMSFRMPSLEHKDFVPLAKLNNRMIAERTKINSTKGLRK